MSSWGLSGRRPGSQPRGLVWQRKPRLRDSNWGYVLSAFVSYLAPYTGVLAEVLTVPATVGEFWMIGYLLVRGIRSTEARSKA